MAGDRGNQRVGVIGIMMRDAQSLAMDIVIGHELRPVRPFTMIVAVDDLVTPESLKPDFATAPAQIVGLQTGKSRSLKR